MAADQSHAYQQNPEPAQYCESLPAYRQAPQPVDHHVSSPHHNPVPEPIFQPVATPFRDHPPQQVHPPSRHLPSYNRPHQEYRNPELRVFRAPQTIYEQAPSEDGRALTYQPPQTVYEQVPSTGEPAKLELSAQACADSDGTPTIQNSQPSASSSVEVSVSSLRTSISELPQVSSMVPTSLTPPGARGHTDLAATINKAPGPAKQKQSKSKQGKRPLPGPPPPSTRKSLEATVPAPPLVAKSSPSSTDIHGSHGGPKSRPHGSSRPKVHHATPPTQLATPPSKQPSAASKLNSKGISKQPDNFYATPPRQARSAKSDPAQTPYVAEGHEASCPISPTDAPNIRLSSLPVSQGRRTLAPTPNNMPQVKSNGCGGTPENEATRTQLGTKQMSIVPRVDSNIPVALETSIPKSKPTVPEIIHALKELDVKLQFMLDEVEILQRIQAVRLSIVLQLEEEEDNRQTSLWYAKLLNREKEMMQQNWESFWLNVERQQEAEERKRAKNKKRLEEEEQRKAAERKRIRGLAVERVLVEAKRRIREEQRLRVEGKKLEESEEDQKRPDEEQGSQDDSSPDGRSTPSSTTATEGGSGPDDMGLLVATDEEVLEAQADVRSQNTLAGRSKIKAYLLSLGLKVSDKRLKRLTYSAEAAVKAENLFREQIARQIRLRDDYREMTDKLVVQANQTTWFKIKMLREHLAAQARERDAAERGGDKARAEAFEALMAAVKDEIEFMELAESGRAPPGAESMITLVPMIEEGHEVQIRWALRVQDQPELENLLSIVAVEAGEAS
ncbi:hypothetical protein MAPG_01240 [Magnaporthiopsis poae ATCC 64411]|uniref:Uncharacterized protein n=1 Tax=Magnaporthiopsis poae (strain ATCC 64411 / 73-15) TaxID=644358 RepID=A0A0C4DN62_MAGP6|nr:hypothetical protein MAPG_01240 [Magnaporthiopsis poae ATCC 64411]